MICARQSVAGLGPLTDHGIRKGHGGERLDYEIVQNYGRGGLLWQFRNYLMTNIGLTQPPPEDDIMFHQSPPYKIVVSIMSSRQPTRNLTFLDQVRLLSQHLDPAKARVETHTMRDYPLRKQIEMVRNAAIYITGCGGGAVTATFLPRGASLLIYYLEDGGYANNQRNYDPARLDWDLFNHLGYVRTHWLGQNTMSTDDDQNAFVQLIQHELDFIQRQSNNQRPIE